MDSGYMWKSGRLPHNAIHDRIGGSVRQGATLGYTEDETNGVRFAQHRISMCQVFIQLTNAIPDWNFQSTRCILFLDTAIAPPYFETMQSKCDRFGIIGIASRLLHHRNTTFSIFFHISAVSQNLGCSNGIIPSLRLIFMMEISVSSFNNPVQNVTCPGQVVHFLWKMKE